VRRPSFIRLRLFAAIAFVGATTVPAFADATGDVKNAVIATAKARSYHIELMTARGPVSGDVVKPGRMHMVTPGSETIIVDQTMYVKVSGTWRKFPAAGVSPMSSLDVAQQMASNHGDMVATDLGPRVVKGTTLHAYRVNNLSAKKTEMFFLDGSGRIVRIETGTTVIRMSRFNAPVSIRAPI